jgi:hypothetical protein
VARLMNEGVFLNDVSGRFSAGYGVRPPEVAPFMEKHGVKTVELLAETGFAAPHAEQFAELAEADPKTHTKVRELIVSTANDPSLLGASIHLLYVGQKQA